MGRRRCLALMRPLMRLAEPAARMRPLLLLAVLAFLAGATAAQMTAAGGPSNLPLVDNRALFVPNWLAICAVALALSAGLVALAFMAGEAFNLPNLRSFARQETYELAASIIIILAVVGGLMAFGVFSQNVAGSVLTSKGTAATVGYCADTQDIYPVLGAAGARNPENALYADVDWFLGCMPTSAQGKYENLGEGNRLVYDPDAPSHWEAAQWREGSSKGVMVSHLMNIYIGLFSLEFMLGPISTFGVSAYLPEPLISSISLDFAPHASLSPISEVTITVTDLVGVGVAALIMQKVLLQFVHINALAVFLPLGLAFRAIPFLRKTGSTIIALSLVMYFVFPLSIWINQQVYFSLQDPQHPMISEWTNYHTLLQACLPQNDAERQNPGLVVQRARQIAADYLANSSEVEKALRVEAYGRELDSNGNPISVYLPIGQQDAIMKALEANGKLVGKYLLHPGFIAGPVLPVDFFYAALVDQITVGAQWFVLNILFLVNSLIICITLFRDISMALGGEPRIFGLSKLV